MCDCIYEEGEENEILSQLFPIIILGWFGFILAVFMAGF